jgi:hypothetical protein
VQGGRELTLLKWNLAIHDETQEPAQECIADEQSNHSQSQVDGGDEEEFRQRWCGPTLTHLRQKYNCAYDQSGCSRKSQRQISDMSTFSIAAAISGINRGGQPCLYEHRHRCK